jgi:hypothetical protein
LAYFCVPGGGVQPIEAGSRNFKSLSFLCFLSSQKSKNPTFSATWDHHHRVRRAQAAEKVVFLDFCELRKHKNESDLKFRLPASIG